MHIFISHQRADESKAYVVAASLKVLGHSCYLDTIDPYLARSGDDLADHIRTELGKCDCLLAVVSAATKQSSWVPWEVGVATEKDYPLGTYLTDNSEPLEFMKKWPVLRNENHLKLFGEALKLVSTKKRNNEVIKGMQSGRAQQMAVREFHDTVKKLTGQ